MEFQFYREICGTERVWRPERKRKNEGNIVGSLAKLNSKYSGRIDIVSGGRNLESGIEGEQNLTPQKNVFLHKDDFELIIFKKLQVYEKV